MARPVLLPLAVAAALAAASGPAGAQSPHGDTASGDDGVAEVEQLISTIEARIQALGQAGNQRDQSLEFLSRQVEAAIGDIGVQQDEKSGLLRQNADLNWQVETLVETRGDLKEELREVHNRHQASVTDLEAELADLNQLLSLETEAKAELSDANDELLTQLRAAKEQHASLDRTSGEQRQEIALLTGRVAALQSELASLSGALASSKRRVAEKEQDLASLQARLDSALATRVEALTQFRSEFFARLGTALGGGPDMRIAGERFVFQSETLFEAGSAELGEDGRRRLVQLARSLHIVSRDIPSEIDWVLRVDGHTDRRAVGGADFPSNWELSTARALAVVRFLIGQGVPPYRLAATGYGEFQPLDRGDDEIAYRRNRRVEFALTQK